MKFRRFVFALALVSLTVAAGDLVAKDPEPEPEPLLSFVPGHYTLAGRQPDDGAAYAGEAVIEAMGQGLLLCRTVAGKTLAIEGKIEVPQPPGEGQVLRFAYSEGGEERTLTCLISGDLDNYARLSCVWTIKGRDHKRPGLEAYYCTDGWSTE